MDSSQELRLLQYGEDARSRATQKYLGRMEMKQLSNVATDQSRTISERCELGASKVRHEGAPEEAERGGDELRENP